MADVLTNLKTQTPRAQLIPSSYSSLLYLSPYLENPTAFDDYYLGIKYKSLVFAGDSMEDLPTLISVAISTNSYKWDKLYKTLSLTYDPIANVDAEIIETHDIASRHNSDTYGAQDATSTSGNAPYDSDEIRNVAKNNTTTEEFENSHDEDAYIDTITTTRSGNIGITSSQELITAERRVADFNYLNIIFKDIMEVIAMPYFG